MPERSRRVGIVGCGRIGMPVLQALHDGRLPGWTLTGVLARESRDLGVVRTTSDLQAFLGEAPELILEVAGPSALSRIGVAALAVADVWTVSGAALADDCLYRALDAAASRSGHRLRLVPGALAGIDGVAMACVEPDAQLRLEIDLPPGSRPSGRLFTGTARQAAVAFPDGVNVAAAAALAGAGLDETLVEVCSTESGHRLSLQADSAYARVRASVDVLPGTGLHPAAACLIACLRRETRTIWVG